MKNHILEFPKWVHEFAKNYGLNIANIYIIHGEIHHLITHRTNKREKLLIHEFIAEIIFGNIDVIAYYNQIEGLSFSTQEMSFNYKKTMNEILKNEKSENLFSMDPKKIFYYLDRYFQYNIKKNTKRKTSRIVFIINSTEVIKNDYCLDKLIQWGNNTEFSTRDISIIYLTDNLDNISTLLKPFSPIIEIKITNPEETI